MPRGGGPPACPDMSGHFPVLQLSIWAKPTRIPKCNSSGKTTAALTLPDFAAYGRGEVGVLRVLGSLNVHIGDRPWRDYSLLLGHLYGLGRHLRYQMFQQHD